MNRTETCVFMGRGDFARHAWYDRAVQLWNSALDGLARVDTRRALNDEPRASNPARANLALELRRLMNELQATAYDPASNMLAYERVAASPLYDVLRECAARLNRFDPVALATDRERIAFWLNVYNTLIVHAVIAFRLRRSVWEDWGFFRRAAYRIGGLRCSADQIENGILRRNRKPPYMPLPTLASDDPRLAWTPTRVDPRIHFALHCASRACPPIASYDAEELEAQLELAARLFVNATTRVAFSGGRVMLKLSPLFKWYAEDFGGRQGIVQFVMGYWDNARDRERVARGTINLRIEWTRYDWALNG